MKNETLALMKLNRALAVAREHDPSMHIQVLMSLLYVANHPGCSPGDIRELLTTTSASAARITGRLSTWERPSTPGLGLVDVVTDINDRRRRLMTLSAKGRRVVQRIQEVLE